ncbi:MAG: DUF5119 domain-containing protein [Bacteroidaceae bacterium]|nr:DUF5119 domain-containing protein [Bacteroidaceae bacterium]
MMRRALWLAVVWVMLLSGCRKELCYDHEHHTERVEYMLALSYDIEWEYNLESHIEWEQYWNEDFGITYDSIRPQKPEGVRVHIYNEDDQSEIVRNIDEEGATIHFTEEGHYAVLLHNNDTEYIVYEGMNSFASAYATTRGVTRSTYLGNTFMDSKGESDETTVNPPDMLFGAYLDSIWVEKSTEVDTLSVTLHPLVFTYLVRYEIAEGAEYVALARGALAGMAKGVNLGNGHTSAEEATVLYDATVTDFGAQALVKSFGVPDYPNPNYSRNPRTYGLNLEVRLQDGSYQQFDFDVTDQVEKQPHGGVIVVKDIKIEAPTGSGGGFDIGVEGWGDAIDIPLPL